MKLAVIGIAWYNESDYSRLLQMFEDRASLPDTYDEWLKAANGILERLKSQGTPAVKAYITAEEFPVWCAANGHRINADARKRFANEFAARTYRDKS